MSESSDAFLSLIDDVVIELNAVDGVNRENIVEESEWVVDQFGYPDMVTIYDELVDESIKADTTLEDIRDAVFKYAVGEISKEVFVNE